jgi:hypothetical protein
MQAWARRKVRFAGYRGHDLPAEASAAERKTIPERSGIATAEKSHVQAQAQNFAEGQGTVE